MSVTFCPECGLPLKKEPYWAWYWTQQVLKGSEPRGNERVVMMVLAHHVGPDGCCYLKEGTITEEAGLSYRQVRRILEALRAMGEIEIT